MSGFPSFEIYDATKFFTCGEFTMIRKLLLLVNGEMNGYLFSYNIIHILFNTMIDRGFFQSRVQEARGGSGSISNSQIYFKDFRLRTGMASIFNQKT